MRTVKRIMFAEDIDMGGVPVKQPLPTQQIEQINPFLLVHHLKVSYEGHSYQKAEGIGPHPHRGFSPVSFIFQGSTHHRDSRGNDRVIEAGGVQWMDAGMGIIHSERPSKLIAEQGGTQEIIQVWINTPKQYKMDQPAYQPFQADELPKISVSEGHGYLSLISGPIGNSMGPVKSKVTVLTAMGNVKNGASTTIPIAKEMNACLYLLDGELSVEGHGLVEGMNLIYFNNDGDHIKIKATKDTRFCLLAGIPIDEPLARHGPYVMNNETEILEAMRDYQMGKMGILIEEFD